MPVLKIKNLEFEISPEDADLLNLRWWLTSEQYPQTYYDGKKQTLNRIIMQRIRQDAPYAHWERVYYIDNNSCNNCRENLSMKRQLNRQTSTRKNPVSGYIGVHWNKYHSAWQVKFRMRGKVVYFGFWEDAEEAARAYDYVVEALFGDRAVTNFTDKKPLTEEVVKRLQSYLAKY